MKLFSGNDQDIHPGMMIAMIPSVLRRIKRLGGKAILDVVDATRTDLHFLNEAIKSGIKNGVEMVMLYDTVGACNVPAIKYLVKKLRNITVKVPIGIHVHDDFGLGTNSTIAAVEEGATYLDLVVNKLGDRAGNTSFEEVVVSLEILYGVDTGIELSKLFDLSKYIEKISGINLPYNKPIVGRNTFLHESELHVMSTLKKDKFWMCFTAYRPELVGQREEVIFGPTTLHGEAIKIVCKKYGLENYEESLDNIINQAHKIITKKKYINEQELLEIIKNIVF